jgi:limonene-1,2-epoxide hydrolase
MTTEEIARRLVALCREAKYEQAQKELYSNEAVSIEPYPTPDFPETTTRGLAAIVEKGRKFMEMIEASHRNEVSEPIVATNSFACTMRLDVTMKGKGRMDMKELCVYQVKDGKIVAEQFYV